ncbi:MAG TPA: acetate--CoA ligase family protein [Alphaproteobacteria bacterium]
MNDLTTRAPALPKSVAVIERMMRPKSIAIVGISSKPGTAGHMVLKNIKANEFPGAVHLVGRSGGEIEGHKVLTSIAELPEGVDVAVFTLPASSVREAVIDCIKRKVGAAVIFAAGFAEVGERAAQDEIAKIARDGGLALLGPNCLGYQNYIDRLWVGFTGGNPIKSIKGSPDPAAAVISQSGGLGSHFKWALEARDIPVAYTISTGNEAGLGLADYIDFLAEDPVARVIVVYVEQIRDTASFLAAAGRARARGKPILMVHPGRGERGKAATGSHTGALAGDYAVMRTFVTHAGILLMDSLDELIDTAEILARFPKPPSKGLGIVTFSGAFCAMAHDFCDDLGAELPPLSPHIEAELKPQVPAFAPPRNPLDLATQALWQPELVGIGCKAILDDPALGSLLVSIPNSSPRHSMRYLSDLIAVAKGSEKPVVLAMLGDRSPLPQDFLDLARQNRVILSRSSEDSLRAMARVTAHGKRLAAMPAPVAAAPFQGLPKLGRGPQPEWLGKQLLDAMGVRIPAGGLARSADEAAALAGKVGFPVAMKAQAAALAHKTEAGGVLLGLADAAAVRAAWATLQANIGRAQPGLTLDGVLVEKMAPKGVELVVGAKRDPAWGPVVLVGLGGVMVEALGDVRLLPPDLPEPAIADEILKLRAAKLLRGFRGAPPVDVQAVAHVAALVGRLMLTMPEIMEIDINPLFAHAEGQGVTAVDALFVSR